MKQKQIAPLIRDIEHNSIVWFPKSNQYVVMEKYDAFILSELYRGQNKNEILNWVREEFKNTANQADNYLSSIEQLKIQQDAVMQNVMVSGDDIACMQPDDGICKYYEVSGKVFRVLYENNNLEALIHPKFSHLAIDHNPKIDHFVNVFSVGEMFAITADGEFFGQWNNENLHYLSGKFSMVLLSKIHKKPEDEWLGVLHASAITNGKSCVLFAGDSGSGKSTTAAVLMANGYRLLADDFVPLDNVQKINYFPAALSVKEKAIDMLSEAFPELENARQYHNVALNKKYRYISSNDDFPTKKLPSKALIFIKYQQNAQVSLEGLSKVDALKKLIPDTWISTKRENVTLFLDWIESTPCYKLVYSDNDEMLAVIKSIFSDE